MLSPGSGKCKPPGDILSPGKHSPPRGWKTPFHAPLSPVVINLPALVIGQRLSHGAAIVAAVDGHVVLESVLANVLEKRLQSGNLHHPITAKALEFVRGDFALAAIGAQLAVVDRP